MMTGRRPVTPEEQIRAAYRAYEKLSSLAPLRAQSPLVPGHGPLDAPVMLIGEAPGEQEVKQGRPFVGPAGHMLDKLLIGAGLLPQLLYVTNTLLYRPPGNRTPEVFEISVSRSRLFAEIYAVRPQLVITLGAVARRALSKGPPVSQCHGKLEIVGLLYGTESWKFPDPVLPGSAQALTEHVFRMLPTYHPSAAIRDRIVHAKMQQDLAVLTRMLEGR
jgi:uracil-DNA glycosylase